MGYAGAKKLLGYKESLDELHAFLLVSRRGMEEWIASRNPNWDEEGLEGLLPEVTHGHAMLQFVKQELWSGLPYLYNIAATRLWSILEAMVDDAVAEWSKQALNADANISEEHRALAERYWKADNLNAPSNLLADLGRKLSSVGQPDKLVRLLGEIGLSIDQPALVKDSITELWHIRNVLVHNNGVADARFIQKMPTAKCSEGQRIHLTDRAHRIYELSVRWWLRELVNRLEDARIKRDPRFDVPGIDPDEDEKAILVELDSLRKRR